MIVELISVAKEVLKIVGSNLMKPLVLLSINLVCFFCLLIASISSGNNILFNVLKANYLLFFYLFLFSLVFLLAYLIKHVYIFFKIRHHFNCRTSEENKILEQFISEQEEVLYLPCEHPAVLSLYNNLIITSETMGGLIQRRFDSDQELESAYRIRKSIFKKLNSLKKSN